VEGIVRNIGMHAGGVLIAPGKITDFCPLYQQPGSDSAVSQFDKDDVEAIGLVKFDFLGLATLTILELAKDFILARRPERAGFNYESLPLDDPKVYRLFSDGLTESVFQFESRGMQGMLRDAKPSRIGDLIALVALYRPGPMDLIPTFVARKHGKETVEYPHPLVEPVLSETYGIMVYQEQVMQTAQVLGGYSLGGADMLRRAMGKKKAEEMAKHREIFREGAAKNKIGPEQADEIFDLMEKFAGYGFNKSHAAAYALLSYHTAWLKAHCPAEFYAANMTIEMGDSDKLKVLLADARQFGISFTPPDVNLCVHRFEPAPGKAGDKLIHYGLGAVKGTGQGAVEAIVAAREGRTEQSDTARPFSSLFDFAKRVDRSRVNKRVVDALVKAGSFDQLHPDRASTLASVGLAFEWADAQAAHAQQSGLFDFGGADEHGASTQEPALVQVEPWSIREKLTLEKTAIGFYLSGHMFDQYEPEARKFCKRRIADLIDSREPQVLCGIVSDLRVINGQRGRVAIFKVDDRSEAIEAVANETILDANRDALRDDEFVVVQGKVQPDRFSGGLRLNVTQVWDLAAARARFGRYLSVQVNGDIVPLTELVKQWPARRTSDEHGDSIHGLGVRIKVRTERAAAELDLGDQGRFWPSDDALARWKQIMPAQPPQVVYD
jgi:DNA polymerase-3 subunit alpha